MRGWLDIKADLQASFSTWLFTMMMPLPLLNKEPFLSAGGQQGSGCTTLQKHTKGNWCSQPSPVKRVFVHLTQAKIYEQICQPKAQQFCPRCRPRLEKSCLGLARARNSLPVCTESFIYYIYVIYALCKMEQKHKLGQGCHDLYEMRMIQH